MPRTFDPSYVRRRFDEPMTLADSRRRRRQRDLQLERRAAVAIFAMIAICVLIAVVR